MTRHAVTVSFLAVLAVAMPADASECDAPRAEWLACEDFEGGGAGWGAWFEASPFVECNGCPDAQTNNPARIRLVDDEAHDGSWSLHMPAEESAGFRGAALAWRSCAGEKRSGCELDGYEQLYWRAWVKLAPDHQYVHHFMSIGGTRPDAYWEGDGNAGCRPNGYRHAGTTVDFNEQHELFFYTYYPEMRCDSGGYCSGDYAQNICDGCATKDMPCNDGLECCWGNHFATDPRPVLERDRWVCLEMMMKLNTPGQADGEMAFWVDGELGHREQGMQWRDVPELQLNKVWVQHYIDSGDADQPNRIWWDDIVVSTEPIGCDAATPIDPGTNNGSTNGAVNNGSATNGGTGNNSGVDPNNGTVVGGPNPPGPDEDQQTPAAKDSRGGCGCSTSRRSGNWLVAFLLALVGVRRRRT